MDKKKKKRKDWIGILKKIQVSLFLSFCAVFLFLGVSVFLVISEFLSLSNCPLDSLCKSEGALVLGFGDHNKI